MKISLNRHDKGLLAACAIVLIVFGISRTAQDLYMSGTLEYPFVAGFCKFALLATLGECVAQRILHGSYVPKGFGLWPKAVVWGLLGIAIAASFSIFYNGAPAMLAASGITWAPEIMHGPLCWQKVFVAFIISFSMNVMFGPALMVAHKLADMHIKACGGSLSVFWTKPNVVEYLKTLDWNSMWKFVLCITIPFFWIPAHTMVFLLPGVFRILVAAILGALLGLILAFAAARQNRQDPPEVLL